MKTLVIHYSSKINEDLSYQHGWVKAFKKSKIFKCVFLNLSDYFPRYKFFSKIFFTLKVILIKFDTIVILHSAFSNADYIQFFIKLIIKLKVAKKVYFIGNEYKLMPAKMNFCKFCNINFFITQTFCEDAINLYKKKLIGCKVFSIPAGGLDDEIFYPGCKYENRKIDIGYRTYDEPFYFGHQERRQLMNKIKSSAKNLNLVCDMSMEMKDRFAGNNWAEFLRSIKSMPASNSGNDFFELNDDIRNKVIQYCNNNPNVEFDDVYKIFFLNKKKISNRLLTGKMIEAAGCKTLLILVEGEYGNYFVPNIHYLEIKKDFSNLMDVLHKLKDAKLCQNIINNAYEITVKHLKFENHLAKLHSYLIN
jgi:hypothetical protein